MTPVERMARAVEPEVFSHYDALLKFYLSQRYQEALACKEAEFDSGSDVAKSKARKQLEAIREPSKAMIEAGVTADAGETLGERVANAYRAMIDAALSET